LARGASAVAEGVATAAEGVAVAGLAGASAVALAFVSPWVGSAEEREKIRKNPNAPEYKDNPYAMVVRGEVKTEEEGAAKNRKKGLKQYKRAEIQEVVDSQLADKVIQEEYGATKAELKQWLIEHPNQISMYQAQPKTIPTTLQRVGSEESTAGAGQGSASYAAIDPRRVDLKKPEAPAETGGGAVVGGMHGVGKTQAQSSAPSTPPMGATAAPMPSSGSDLGKKAVSATNENNDSKLKENMPEKPLVINKTNNNTTGSTQGGEKTSVPIRIRNDEDMVSYVMSRTIRVV
jgi:hypothetical protein